jgi:hypothetical protein
MVDQVQMNKLMEAEKKIREGQDADALLTTKPQYQQPMGTCPMFSPEVEARRADYERIAEGLANLVETSQNTISGMDFDPTDLWPNDPTKPEDYCLRQGIDNHIADLIFRSSLSNNPEALRAFYVNLRLMGDQTLYGPWPHDGQSWTETEQPEAVA